MKCSECSYESPEEFYRDGYQSWEYYCNKADSKRIELEEGEVCPEWCPINNEEVA